MASPEISSTQEPSAEPENDVLSNPEPLPEWSIAFTTWNVWWEVHNYGFAILFAVLAAFCVYCLVRLKRAQTLTLTRYFTAVTGLLFMFSFTRCLYLALDPYEGHKYLHLPVVFDRIVFALGYPCLTSIFSLINFTFVKVNNLFLIAKRLQDIKFLSSIIVIHFVLVLGIYLIVTFSPRLARLFIVCQAILIVWWLALVLAFLYSAWLVKMNEKSKMKYINKVNDAGQAEANKTTSQGSKRILYISGLVALAGLASIGLEFYSLFEVYNLYDLNQAYVEAWPWWGYQTANRVIELSLCMITAYIIYPTTKTASRAHNSTANSSSTQDIRVRDHTVESQL